MSNFKLHLNYFHQEYTPRGTIAWNNYRALTMYAL